MILQRLSLFILALLCCFTGKTATASEDRSVVFLGFPIVTIEQLPWHFQFLNGPPPNRQAFIHQLHRQAAFIAARDELGAFTRDELLGETAPEASIQIENISYFPIGETEFAGHLQFLLGSKDAASTRWKKGRLYASNVRGTHRSRLDDERMADISGTSIVKGHKEIIRK